MNTSNSLTPAPADSSPLFSGRPVIAMVGAGSLNWGRSIVVDLLLNPDLAEAEIRLIDVLPDRLALVHEWCEFARRRLCARQRIVATTDLKEGLQGASVCLSAISVGGDRMWRYDAMHPQLDVLAPRNETVCRRLLREMIDFQKEWIQREGH